MTQEHKNYLDALRESGVINMYGASPYLQDRFGLSRKESKEVLLNWMKSYGENHE